MIYTTGQRELSKTGHGIQLINEVVLYILLSRNNCGNNGETLILRVN